MASRFCVVMITAPAGRVSRKIADTLLKFRLAACVNILPAVESRYWWGGKLRKGRESLLLVKTRRALLSKLETRVAATHPYKTPEIISLPILRGNARYLRWINAETRGTSQLSLRAKRSNLSDRDSEIASAKRRPRNDT